MHTIARTFRSGKPLLLAMVLLAACQAAPTAKPPVASLGASVAPDALPDFALSGGKATVRDDSVEAFSHRFPDMDGDHRTHFFSGESLFDQSWVTAVSSTEARDGLGPWFNARSCAACHGKDGRSNPFDAAGKPAEALLVRLSRADGSPDPVYGGQLQPFAIGTMSGEGQLEITRKRVSGSYGDGKPYELEQPAYQLTNLAYGPAASDLQTSVRVAPQLIGLGLLEALPEAEILAASDPDDRNHDGISGRPNHVLDKASGKIALGRFGWKANQPSLRQQVAAAFAGDIGIASEGFASDETATQAERSKAWPAGGSPELPERLLERVVFYNQNLAVPARRQATAPAVMAGERRFGTLGCAACHRPSYRLGSDTIRPYTDMLLHDLGPELADHRPDGEATGREWRTPPLWGIGLVHKVNGHSRFLHDGRARNLNEAVLWHGGEAEAAREAFRKLDTAGRDELIRFLESL